MQISHRLFVFVFVSRRRICEESFRLLFPLVSVAFSAQIKIIWFISWKVYHIQSVDLLSNDESLLLNEEKCCFIDNLESSLKQSSIFGCAAKKIFPQWKYLDIKDRNEIDFQPTMHGISQKFQKTQIFLKQMIRKRQSFGTRLFPLTHMLQVFCELLFAVQLPIFFFDPSEKADKSFVLYFLLHNGKFTNKR